MVMRCWPPVLQSHVHKENTLMNLVQTHTLLEVIQIYGRVSGETPQEIAEQA